MTGEGGLKVPKLLVLSLPGIWTLLHIVSFLLFPFQFISFINKTFLFFLLCSIHVSFLCDNLSYSICDLYSNFMTCKSNPLLCCSFPCAFSTCFYLWIMFCSNCIWSPIWSLWSFSMWFFKYFLLASYVLYLWHLKGFTM